MGKATRDVKLTRQQKIAVKAASKGKNLTHEQVANLIDRGLAELVCGEVELTPTGAAKAEELA